MFIAIKTDDGRIKGKNSFQSMTQILPDTIPIAISC